MNPYAKLAGAAAMALWLCACHNEKKASVVEDIRVKTMVAATSEITTSRPYSGTVEESASTALSFAAPGTIQTMAVSAGDRVSKGQLIATLDPTSLQHAYDISAAALAEAQDAYNRMKQLHDANSLPDMQWVQVQNTLKQAQSAEAIAKKALADAKLFAPASGYISEKLADAGMNAVPGIPVVKLLTINPAKVTISVPENAIATIPSKAAATIKVGALGGKTFTGALTEKGIAAKPLSRAYEVKFTVANPDGELLPGMICDVVMDKAEAEQAMVLPINSVLLDADNQNFVWLCIGGRAAKRIVQVEGMDDRGLAISGGIAPGDSVIVEGLQKVSEGTKVTSL